MSKSFSASAVFAWRLACHRVALVCLLSIALAGCDGGIFGTGSGDEDFDATTESESDTNAPLTDTPDADTVEEPGDVVSGAEGGADAGTDASTDTDGAVSSEVSDNVSSQTPINVSFSNTTPSGVIDNLAALPALKLINLSNADLLLDVEDAEASSGILTVSPDSTSDNVLVNTGESRVSINASSAQDTAFEFSIDPLNSAEDSVTTVVIAGNDISVSNNQLSEPVSFALLDTRVVASAAGMAEIRAIDLSVASSTGNAPVYTLTNTDESSGNTGLALTFPQNDPTSPVAYSLINPGSYLMESSDAAFSAQTLEIEADAVYTVIISDDDQTPVYLERDD